MAIVTGTAIATGSAATGKRSIPADMTTAGMTDAMTTGTTDATTDATISGRSGKTLPLPVIHFSTIRTAT
ncbi:hypothetical protein WI61_18035 [Burkholderia cepacia]|nr:hypothetical protein WI49_08660 [Burkholderia cepacia]KVA69285.1 hypothetical protein WI48_30370 [Burkholderia cepacia]KVA83654.1 hypothetical protein WI50_20195 [Burkholderia cepacia]KVA95627.1 hypothetical protein WI52_35485 [Burkholderia cepacia]KVA97120.1 hypothetical protein WI51_34485 [Burkholderia cepacia]